MKTFFQFVWLLKKKFFFEVEQTNKKQVYCKKVEKKIAVIHQRKTKKKRDTLP